MFLLTTLLVSTVSCSTLFSSDLGISERWQRLRESRDMLLSPDLIERAQSDLHGAIQPLMPILEQAARLQQATGTACDSHREPLFQTDNLNERLSHYIQQCIGQDQQLSSLSVETIGILDVLQSGVPFGCRRYVSGYHGIGIGPSPQRVDPGITLSSEHEFLIRRFPGAQHMLFIDPSQFNDEQALTVMVRHSLVRLVQPPVDHDVVVSMRWLREVEADVKSIFLKKDRLWLLCPDYQMICTILSAHRSSLELQMRNFFTQELTKDIPETDAIKHKVMKKAIVDFFDRRMHSSEDSVSIMHYFLTKVTSDDSIALTDDVFEVVLGLQTALYYKNFFVGNSHFSRLLQKAKQLPRVQQLFSMNEWRDLRGMLEVSPDDSHAKRARTHDA